MRATSAWKFSVALLLMTFAAGLPAGANSLKVGLKEVPLSTDPHFMTQPAMYRMNSQIFEPLIIRDSDTGYTPLLATSWEIVDDTTWVFKLRKDVKWHDGSPFTADDVVFSYARAPNVPNTPTSFRTYLAQVKKVEAIDPLTVKITTNGPAPSLLEKLSYVMMVSKKNGEGAVTADYHSGKAMVGTAAYKFGSWVQNEKTILEKNPDYWGAKPLWDTITYSMIPNDSARVAALLAGDIDVAESVASSDVDRLSNNPKTRIFKKLTYRLAHLTFNIAAAAQSGKLTGPNGETLEKNPLEDALVRRALFNAIDTDAITKRLYAGEAEPTPQYVAPGIAGNDPDIAPHRGSADRGRKALEELGMVGKFKMTITVGQGMFPQSTQAAEAIAQFWTRAGVQTTVETLAVPVYLTRTKEKAFAAAMSGYNNSSGTADNYFPTMMHTVTGAYGALNNTGYSNPKMDRLIEDASSTMEETKRAALWREASKMALDESVYLPLYNFYNTHASRADIEIRMRSDGALRPENITLKK